MFFNFNLPNFGTQMNPISFLIFNGNGSTYEFTGKVLIWYSIYRIDYLHWLFKLIKNMSEISSAFADDGNGTVENEEYSVILT